jgi:hypothetical protein
MAFSPKFVSSFRAIVSFMDLVYWLISMNLLPSDQD